MENFSSWLDSAGHGVLAAVGGLLGYVMREQSAGNRPTLFATLIQTLSSGFVGFLTYQLCMAVGLDGPWTIPIVGVFGWLGATVTIQIFERIIFEKLGVKISKKENDQ